jgi:hypothetical protein
MIAETDYSEDPVRVRRSGPSGKGDVKHKPFRSAQIPTSGGHVPRMHENGDARSRQRILYLAIAIEQPAPGKAFGDSIRNDVEEYVCSARKRAPSVW